jgi:hypothetical protein
MGIQVEFNPDLALRNYQQYTIKCRDADECIPEELVSGQTYSFKKRGQRIYRLQGEIPLVETMGNQHLSRPLASIQILEATHCVEKGEVWTRGRYLVVETFKDEAAHFDGFARIRC